MIECILCIYKSDMKYVAQLLITFTGEEIMSNNDIYYYSDNYNYSDHYLQTNQLSQQTALFTGLGYCLFAGVSSLFYTRVLCVKNVS